MHWSVKVAQQNRTQQRRIDAAARRTGTRIGWERVQSGWNGKARTYDGQDYDNLNSDTSKPYVKYDAILNEFSQEMGPMPTGGSMSAHEIWWAKTDLGPGTITLWRI